MHAPESPAAGPYVWQQPQATVLPQGDLEWAPTPFVFQTNNSIRYIDFTAGNDNNDGRSRATAWKRHPWDPLASGVARAGKGEHTYIFKRGVLYRGALKGADAGSPNNPIRLTSDPSWGSGEAVIAGSEVVSSWSVATSVAPYGMPESAKVYYVDLSFFPRNVWVVTNANGGVTRLKLARTPNWKESNPDDPASEWWYWQNPDWWRTPNPHRTNSSSGTPLHLGVDTAHLTRSADYYTNALVWTEWGIVMGTPFPTKVETVDTTRKALGFQGVWYNDSGTLMRGCRYYLEDKPHYLDEPGEFWVEARSGGSRLFVRFPGDRPPGEFRVEAASRINLIDMTHASNLKISGLTFSFGNVYRDLTARFFVHSDVLGSAFRLRGTGTNLSISHCRFTHLNMAVRCKATADTDRLDNLAVSDNEILETDHGAIDISDSSRYAKTQPPFGPLGRVEVTRNRLHNIGQRPARSEWGHAIVLQFADAATVAGNIITRAHGAGLFVFGGKGDGDLRDKPFSRTLMFQNKVQDSLLKANDWGGIEFWQGGPAYIFNNVSANPRGFWHWSWLDKSATDKVNTKSGLGQAYYLDGGFKAAVFNNVAWGKPGTLDHPWTACAFQIVLGVDNQIFNNTVYSLTEFSRTHGAQGGRNHYLGNVAVDLPIKAFFTETGMGQNTENLALHTLAFSSNVFGGRAPGKFGGFMADGAEYATLDAFAQALQAEQPYATDVGIQTQATVFTNAAQQDFRLAANSPALERGARVFVPWPLARTVGEWHFYRSQKDPKIVDDQHWFMPTYYVRRSDYWATPRFPLHGAELTKDSYGTGILEDWCAGALRLSAGQFLVCSNSAMKQSYSYRLTLDNGTQTTNTVSGNQIWSPDVGTEPFILECVVRIEPGHAGLLLGKMGDSNGYKLEIRESEPVLILKQGGVETSYRVAQTTADGKWHHLLLEVLRTGADPVRCWIDGKRATGQLTGAVTPIPLANEADLLVGGGPGHPGLAMELDFLRIARGSLAEAFTTAEELYAWEFLGPFLRDFRGLPASGRRDAGALELPRFTSKGVPWAWMSDFGLGQTGFETEAAHDPDADGQSNWQEYFAGTDPLDSKSRLLITGLEPQTGGWKLSWLGGTNGLLEPYRVEQRDLSAPSETWTVVSDSLPRIPGTNTCLVPFAGSNVLYRVSAGP